MKRLRNIKYLNFIMLLGITGICFFYREPLLQKLNEMLHTGLKVYEQAIGFPENAGGILPGESQDGVSVSGGDGTVSGGDGTVSGSDSSVSGNGGTLSGNEGTLSGNGAGSGTQPLFWEYASVDETWFDDAVFIGDSRTVGLSEYGGLSNTTFYASTGLTVFKLFDAKIIPTEGSREKATIEEALSEKQFAKIYLMIGINEMGTGTVESFMEKYKEAVAHLKELQPGAVIYLQSIMRVSAERSAQGDYITNEGIDARNAEIAKLADNQTIFYLDVNSVLCDETGGLAKDYTFDGVHLKAKYIAVWKQYLMEHAVRFY
ncbi:MAG: GDSL-type esterase/lipase family protein [Lachnospiraceae bacterium]|nr:GDSL-type esterase/lipase family protein [Lachnospiraceae bacterium]